MYMCMLTSDHWDRESGVPGGGGAPEGSDSPEGGCATLPTTLPGGLAGGSGS